MELLASLLVAAVAVRTESWKSVFLRERVLTQ